MVDRIIIEVKPNENGRHDYYLVDGSGRVLDRGSSSSLYFVYNDVKALYNSYVRRNG